MRRLLPAFLLGVFLVGCSGTRDGSRGTDIGMRPVSFSLPKLGGGHDALDAHRGKPVLFDLWATWCPPCREELPELSALARSERNLVVLAADQGEARDVVLAVARKEHLQMPILLDRDQRYGAAYATVGLPTAVILDANGKIAAVETGSHTAAEWRAIIAKALAR